MYGIRAIVFSSISCDSFLDCLPHGRSNTSKKNLHTSKQCGCVGSKENRMSIKIGDRARLDRQRRAKIHNGSRIRELWKAIRAQETTSAQNVARAGKTLGSNRQTEALRTSSE